MGDLPVENDETGAAEVPEIPPEEGVWGWLCVVGAFLGIFSTFGFLNAIGVFQTTYEQITLRNYSASSIAWIFAMQLALMWTPGPFYGRLIDTYGPAPVLYPCSLLCVFSLCMTSLAREYYQIFLAQGLGFGIGAGGVFSSCMISVGQWFARRRGLATGIAAAGSSMGGVIFPIFVDRVNKDVGFDGAVRYTALFMGIFLAASCLLVRSRFPRKKWNPDARWFEARLFRQPQFAFYTFGIYFVMWGLWAPFDYLPSMASHEGFSPTLALYLISIINATSVPGRIVPGYVADYLGHFNIITICSLFTGGSILALWVPFNYHASHAGTIVFGLVFGFVSGAVVSLMMACVAKTGPLETLGQRFGTFQIVISVSCLTGLPIEGAILNRQHNTDFSGLQIFAAVSILIGTGCLALATVFLRRECKTWKV